MSDSRPRLNVSAETWRRLNARKEPGDTFEDVIERLLEATRGADETASVKN